ncbi:LPS-assembly protein LptD [Spiribacter salinus]|uniref:LPS-assembly protein LptD n=1 Tax=Spiribacter salinus TaxID=1335746 RepID=UPI001C953CC1|nr:LPS assembly protein LptD [Spiribacter salinus]MBY5269121.1 hypothetical protein [Spiribacter salinus]
MAGLAAADEASGRWALCGAPLLAPVDDDADLVLKGETLRYDHTDGRLLIDQAVQLREAGLLIEADSVDYQLDADRGRFEGVREYRIAAGHLQGSADRIIREGPARSRYEGVTLSTCMPDNELWRLDARQATVNTDTRQGRARHSVLSIADVPVFYTPYLPFPIGEERMSGLLAPTLGQSDRNGTTVALPWYWNIAPNQDATITPTVYGKRGVLLGTQYRYLHERGQGEINASYLPNDDRFGDDRWAIDQTHDWQMGNAVRGELRQQRTSDPDYNDDFNNDFDYRSASFLESRAQLSWADQGFIASVDAQDWQRIANDESSPYARRPRVQFDYDPIQAERPVKFSIASAYTDFYNADASQEQGIEYNVAPRLSMPINALAYRFEPAVAFQHSGYDLTRPEGETDSPSASVPIYTADASVFLERPHTLFNGVYQTLEPRIQYRNVPDRGQDALPDFGSPSRTRHYARLFRPTPFDNEHTEQASVGLTTRYIDNQTGREHLRASLGQAFYYHDDAPRDRSDYITELRLSLPRGLVFDADYRWDPEDADTNKLRALLRWRGAHRAAANLALRQQEDRGNVALNQITASAALPITPQWQVFAGVREDLEAKQTLARFFGIQQSGCCHSLRVVVNEDRRLADSAGQRTLEQAILFELELKGLGGIGDRIRPFLSDEIDGYNAERPYP